MKNILDLVQFQVKSQNLEKSNQLQFLKTILTNVLFVQNLTKVNLDFLYTIKQIIKILNTNATFVKSHFQDPQMSRGILKLFIRKLRLFRAKYVEKILGMYVFKTLFSKSEYILFCKIPWQFLNRILYTLEPFNIGTLTK